MEDAVNAFTKQWHRVPPKAFAQTKLNLRMPWLKYLENEDDAERLYEAIAGDEFQTNLEQLMASLKRKK